MLPSVGPRERETMNHRDRMKLHSGLLIAYAMFAAMPETNSDAFGWVLFYGLVAVSCVGLFSATMREMRRQMRTVRRGR